MSESKVNHPNHYGGDTTYETIKVIEAWGLGFHLGNAVKYISRAGKKPGQNVIDDLKKAEWYIQREIARISADHKPQGDGSARDRAKSYLIKCLNDDQHQRVGQLLANILSVDADILQRPEQTRSLFNTSDAEMAEIIERWISRSNSSEEQAEDQEPEEGLSDYDLWIMWNKISPVVSIDCPDRTHRIINIEKTEIRNVAFNMIADDRQGFLVDLKDHNHVDVETRHKFATPTILKATLHEVFEAINEQVPTWAEYHSMFFEFAVKPEVITATHHVVTTRLYFRD